MVRLRIELNVHHGCRARENPITMRSAARACVSSFLSRTHRSVYTPFLTRKLPHCKQTHSKTPYPRSNKSSCLSPPRSKPRSRSRYVRNASASRRNLDTDRYLFHSTSCESATRDAYRRNQLNSIFSNPKRTTLHSRMILGRATRRKQGLRLKVQVLKKVRRVTLPRVYFAGSTCDTFFFFENELDRAAESKRHRKEFNSKYKETRAFLEHLYWDSLSFMSVAFDLDMG